jgi:hypothetical protein
MLLLFATTEQSSMSLRIAKQPVLVLCFGKVSMPAVTGTVLLALATAWCSSELATYSPINAGTILSAPHGLLLFQTGLLCVLLLQVLLHSVITGGGDPSYNQGDTLVHEVGHWVSLLAT